MLYYSFFLYVTGFNYLIFCLQYGLHNTLNCKIWTLPLSVLFWVSWKVFMVPFAFLTEKDLLWLHVCESCSVMSDSLWPHGLYTPWNSPGQNTGVGSLFLLQGIFPTQGSNSGLLHCRRILNQLSHKGSPVVCVCVCVYICMCVCVYLYIYIFSSYNDFVFISDWLVW